MSINVGRGPRRLSRHLLAVVSVAAVVGSLCGAVALLHAEPATALTLTKAERQVVRLINQERTERGLVTLRVRATLCRSARAHSRDMLRRQYFSHVSPSGVTLAGRICRCRYVNARTSSWRAGETLARARGSRATAVATVARWMRSSVHRRILLDPKWRDVGVGRAKGTFKGLRGTVLTTVDFGRRSR